MSVIQPTAVILFDESHYDDLIERCQFLTAWQYCVSCWGPVTEWGEIKQRHVAIILFSQLGVDRDSDAVLLRSWRRFPADPELCLKVLCYKLNRFGPIIAERFSAKHQTILQQLSDPSDLLAVEVCCQSSRKNYVEARMLLQKAREISRDNSWLDRIELTLLRDQQLYAEELHLAQQLLQRRPRVSLVLDVARALVRNQQSTEALSLLADYAVQFQSCRVWYEYIVIASRLMAWPQCQWAIDGYRTLQPQPDRDDRDLIWSSQGKIALAQGDKATAIKCYSQTRHPYYRNSHQNLQQWHEQGEMIKLLPVPHERQGHLTCAPATMAALTRYWQMPSSQQSIAEQICFDGTPDTLERKWLTEHGFAYIELELTAALTYQLIDAGLPFALVTTSGFSSHLQAVVGYHKGLGIAYLMDPSRDYTSEFQLESGLTDEAAFGPRALIFVPKQQADLLQPFKNNTSELYVLYDRFSLAMQSNHLAEACGWLQQLCQQDPQHRLTLIAQRWLAIEQNDETAIQRFTGQLLDRFPGQIVWLNSKFQSLKNLGQGEAALQFLFATVEKTPHTDLKIRLFRQIYAMPLYRKQTLKLLAELEVAGSYYAEVYDLLADFYWQEKQYVLSCRYYFYACCLDDTRQDFVESYYKAAVFLQQTDQALGHLQARFDKYGARSASPAISLYHAFNWQSKSQLGLDVLASARQLRPDDQELITFSLKALLYHGQTDAFELLFETSAARLSDSQRAYWQAKKAEWFGDFTAAAGHFKQCFSLTPWQSSVADPYFSALKRCGYEEQIIDELARLAQLDATHPTLLDYKADWHPDPQVVANAVQQLAENSPHAAGYQRRYIRQLMQQAELNQARICCESLLVLLPDQDANRLLYAQILHQQQQAAAAKIQVETILKHNIDDSDAIELLLDLSVGLEDKRQTLSWLISQLEQQTNYGDALLDVAHAAQRYLSAEQQKQLVQVLANNTHVWSSRLAWSWLLQQHDFEAAYHQLRQGITDFPLLPRLHLELAELAVQMQRFDEAHAAYQQALVINPSYSRASRQFASFLELHGSAVEEIAVLEAALKFEPTDGILHGFLADVYIRTARIDLARIHLEKAVRFNHHYLWGWHTFNKVCVDLGAPEAALLLASQLHQQSPHLAGPLRALAALTASTEQKVQYWQQAIALTPHNYDVHQALLEHLLDRGHFAAMFAHVAQHFAGQPQPFAIASLIAKASEQIGQPQRAIDVLTQAIEISNPELKYWQQLFELQQQSGEKSDLLHAVQLLIERQPNQAMSLCTAAEQFIFLKRPADAENQLEKALQLAPDDRYILLTMIDFLLEQQRLPQALEVVDHLLLKHPDVWVKQRKLKVLLALEQIPAAQQVWQELIESGSEQAYIYMDVMEVFPKHTQLLMQQLSTHLAVASNMAGYCLARWQQAKNAAQTSTLIQTLMPCKAWDGLYEFYLEDMADREKLPPAKMIEPFGERVAANPLLAAKMANIYRVNTRLYQAAQVYRGIAIADRPCYVSYHYGITLLDLNRWPEALQVLREGAQSEPDNCLHNLQLWLLAADYVNNGNLPHDIEYVNRQELTETEQLVYDCLMLAVASSEQMSASELLSSLRDIRKSGGAGRQIDRVRKVGQAMFRTIQTQQDEFPLLSRLALKLCRFSMF
ncbi:MAG: tetratricopeptide repeat protein [Gammaproteobacteria bacterium]|nr:tetratricopeptide repeat protein [Gammaproteobacteria bacterium]